MQAITDTTFMGLPLYSRGKVRDIYEAGDDLLIVSTDRISAFDVVMNEGVPGKGVVLNTISRFWFEKTAEIIPNHMLSTDVSDFPPEFRAFDAELAGRSMLVRRAKPLPVECVVRGYLAGSGWKDYQREGKVCGLPLPEGLRQADRLPEPLFTPSSKAELGEHDENITYEQVIELVGVEIADALMICSLDLYHRGTEIAESRGVILADTKFEFGMINGELTLIDELFTPDSSRFWPADQYEPGHDQVNLDKQLLRDWLEGLDWDKTPPPPTLPGDVIDKTAERYRYIKGILLGE